MSSLATCLQQAHDLRFLMAGLAGAALAAAALKLHARTSKRADPAAVEAAEFERRSALLAELSHELRTPLNGVVAVAEVLAGTRLDARQQGLVHLIRQSGANLNGVLGQLLDMRRLEADAEPLPARVAEVPAPAVVAEPAVTPTDRPFRVLVVEDNQVNRQVAALILEAVGAQCVMAENGQDGVVAIMAQDFDAVLMDIQMPVMDGLEATRRIRAWERDTGRLRTPIYIVSANCLQEHVTAGAAAGADGHLPKPISPKALLGALQPHVDLRLVA